MEGTRWFGLFCSRHEYHTHIDVMIQDSEDIARQLPYLHCNESKIKIKINYLDCLHTVPSSFFPIALLCPFLSVSVQFHRQLRRVPRVIGFKTHGQPVHERERPSLTHDTKVDRVHRHVPDDLW